jgi:hypothetical protein
MCSKLQLPLLPAKAELSGFTSARGGKNIEIPPKTIFNWIDQACMKFIASNLKTIFYFLRKNLVVS